MAFIVFTIPGVPHAWQRARRSRHGGFFVDADTARYKRAVAAAFRQAAGQGWAPVAVPVKMAITAWYPFPKHTPKGKREGLMPKGTRPDIDNIAKGVLDALNGVAWEDDGQVYSIEARKYYGARGGVEVRLCTTDKTEE